MASAIELIWNQVNLVHYDHKISYHQGVGQLSDTECHETCGRDGKILIKCMLFAGDA